MLPWSAFYDTTEDVGELAFPASVFVYNKMCNDSQIAALKLALLLPIFGYRWYIDPNGASDEAVQHVANDFNLPIEGEDPKPTGRRRDRFSMGDYLYHCMLKLDYGFMFFEQVFRLGEDQKLHIRKLAPRRPGSIWQIQQEPDGGLDYIRQYPVGKSRDPNQPNGVFSQAPLGVFMISQGPIFPVDRLVAHVNDKGRQLVRPAVVARDLQRVASEGPGHPSRCHEARMQRHGCPDHRGAPGSEQSADGSVGCTGSGLQDRRGSRRCLAQRLQLTLNGVAGSLPDSLGTLRYYDEAMARRYLATFTTLGTTQTGSRALGNTFVDSYGLAQQSVAQTIADTTNEHVIEDLTRERERERERERPLRGVPVQ